MRHTSGGHFSLGMAKLVEQGPVLRQQLVKEFASGLGTELKKWEEEKARSRPSYQASHQKLGDSAGKVHFLRDPDRAKLCSTRVSGTDGGDRLCR